MSTRSGMVNYSRLSKFIDDILEWLVNPDLKSPILQCPLFRVYIRRFENLNVSIRVLTGHSQHLSKPARFADSVNGYACPYGVEQHSAQA